MLGGASLFLGQNQADAATWIPNSVQEIMYEMQM